MSSDRRIFFVFVLATVLNGTDACFRNDEYQNHSITTGSSFYQECQCTEPGHTITNLRWLSNNGVSIEHAEQSGPGRRASVYMEEQLSVLPNSLNLLIPSITKTLSGTYKCVTEVNGVTYTQSHEIAAYDPLYFYETPNDQHLVYGKTSKIMCQPKSDTAVVINWQKDPNKEEPIDISSDEKYFQEKDGLVIYNVTENDAGMYKCMARAIATNEEVDEYITVVVITEPKIQSLKANPENYEPTTVVAGMNLTIECIAEGMPHPEYFWNKTLETDAQEYKVSWRQEINTIIFDEIKPEDTGVYTCYAYSLAGISAMDIHVKVLIPSEIIDFPSITTVEGTTIQISCNATGDPEPTISITYDGRDSYDDSNEVLPEDSESFPNMEFVADISKEGTYVCIASNTVNAVRRDMNLTVLHKPYIKNPDEFIWGWEGKTINFSCDHDSNPPATVTWRYLGNEMLAEEDLEINRKLLTTLNNYTTKSYFTLTINNETAFGIYECTAKNVHGEANKRIKLVEGFKPGSVKNVIYEDLTATSITFYIDGPDQVNGPDVNGFTATYDEKKNYNITDIHINRTWAIGRPFKLDKLKPNTSYLVRLAALNEVGAGTWTDPIEFNTLNKSVPEPPVWNEEPITLAMNSHVLKWRAPDDNGEPIDHYTLRYCSEDDEEPCKTKSLLPSTELELEDLEFNTTYFLELVAHNSVGDSVAANVSVLVPAPQLTSPTTLLSGGAIIGISIVIVILCLLLLDVLLLVWRRQGIIATCCYKKDNKRKESALNFRDKKGLLPDGEPEERVNSVRDNGHKEYQYNKNTGIVTGKHSAV